MGRGLAWIGVVVFLLSWFVPVVKDQEKINDVAELGRGLADAFGKGASKANGPEAQPYGPDWLPGWQAARVAWDLLTGDQGRTGAKKGWRDTVLGATCLTNVFMVFAIFVLLGPRGSSTPLGLLLVLSAVVNAGWIYLTEDATSVLSAGYYMWTASFLFVGVAFLRSRDRGALHPV